MDVALLDEYMDAELPDTRFLMAPAGNATNSTPPPPEEEGLPWVPLLLVGGLGAGAAGYFMTRPGYTYETHAYDHAAESGLLDDEEYDIEYDDGSDYEEDD